MSSTIPVEVRHQPYIFPTPIYNLFFKMHHIFQRRGSEPQASLFSLVSQIHLRAKSRCEASTNKSNRIPCDGTINRSSPGSRSQKKRTKAKSQSEGKTRNFRIFPPAFCKAKGICKKGFFRPRPRPLQRNAWKELCKKIRSGLPEDHDRVSDNLGQISPFHDSEYKRQESSLISRFSCHLFPRPL